MLNKTYKAEKNNNDAIRRNIDQGNMTRAVFIDLGKAFDSIDHSILLGKLSSMNIVGREHGWFTDYFCGRMQTTDYHGTFSNKKL